MEAALVCTLEKLVKALETQIVGLSDQISSEPTFEKRKADEIQAFLKALEKAQELADQYRIEAQPEPELVSMRDVLNEIEERIENLAGHRVEQILSGEHRSLNSGSNTQEGTASPEASATASIPR